MRDRRAAARRLVARSGIFDAGWYLDNLPVDEETPDPLGHFMERGYRLGLGPSRHFDPEHYVAQVPHLAGTGINPLVHYLRVGWRFGFSPAAGFRPPAEADRLPDVCPLVVALALETGDAGQSGGRRRRDRWPAVKDKKSFPAPEQPGALPVTNVAFYLPQFHPIPENDEWWGAGFTEWTNVRRGRPRFRGHHQPHVPGDLGYYDLLRDPDIMRRQADLARRHGVGAFCFYVYWFGGQRLLEGPVDRWLADPSLDMPFCICWANENWTRTWDGKSKRVLMGQQHSPDDDIRFISEMADYLRDPRYLRVGGRPLLVLYRPGELPDARATADRWRNWCRENGIGEIHLAYVQSFDRIDPVEIGFDHAIEFPPNNLADQPVEVPDPEPGYEGITLDWGALSRRPLEDPGYPLWRGVVPSWDNEARRPGRGTTLVGSAPALFSRWLARAARDTMARFGDRSERLVWINAWNEWAEGAHLEPDRTYGYDWLHATRDAMESAAGIGSGTGPGVVVIAHDLQRNGAQLGSLALAGELSSLGRRVRIVACGAGPLEREAAAIAPTMVVIDDDAGAVRQVAEELVARGFTTALANSSVSGFFARAMRDAGARVIGLVHELPGVLAADPMRGERAEQMATAAHELVFPAESVRRQFPYQIPAGTRVRIRPQGRYQRSGSPSDPEAARRLRAQLGIADDARIVLGVGYGDRRKGADILLSAMSELSRDGTAGEVHLVWLGELDTSDESIAAALAAAPSHRVQLPGFQPEPALYYQGADILALSSREDPFPSVTLEALDAGLPVVAFRGRTGQDELVEQTGGVLVDDLSAVDLAAGLRSALHNDVPPVQPTRREYIAERFNYRKYVMDLLVGTPATVPRVSVVVPNYNYGDLIGDRLRQILSQTHPVYELIVLDDASTDDSLEQIYESLGATDVSVRVITNEHNSGSVYRQWTRGVEACSGELVWIAEADDVAAPEFLAEVVAPMSDPDVVLSYCESRQVDESGQELAPDYREWTDLGVRDYTRRYVRSGAAEIRDCLAVKNTIPNASAVVMRLEPLRDLLGKEGARIAREHPTTGDWVIYTELLRTGRIAFSPLTLNSHRRHSGSVIASEVRDDHLAEIARVHELQLVRSGDPTALRRRHSQFMAALR